MPLYLEPKDVISDLEDFHSVLIVPCPICPPMSLAMRMMANATTKFGFPPKMELERHPVTKSHRRGPHPTDAELENEAEST